MCEELKNRLTSLLQKPATAIHFIGVGGSGMTGLARIFLSLGHPVSGSDLRLTPEVRRLTDLGLIFRQGHEATAVHGAGVVIYSSAVGPENPELKAALEQKIMTVRRGEMLAVLAERKQGLVVAGMHGKTTSASMLAYVLREAGMTPSHYVGAEIPILEASAAWDRGEHFVIEADESDGTLAGFHPQHSLILNIEEEHLDYYPNLEAIFDVFGKLIVQTKGSVIYCADDRNAALLCSHRQQVVSYGFSETANFQAQDVRLESFASSFLAVKDRKVLGRVSLSVPGRQNISNALGVIALAMEVGVPFERAAAALAEFRGAKRRFEIRFQSPDFMVVDDYAHHPTEIKATLAAARNSGWKRLISLFQPHRYSRTKLLREEFATAFAQADMVFLTEVYAASEKPLEGISGETIAESVRATGHPSVTYISELNRLRSAVSRQLDAGDLVVTMGAGDIHEVASSLARELTWFAGLRVLLAAESRLARQEPLQKHTSIRIGGPAQLWLEPGSEEDLIKALRYAHEHKIPVTVMGRGTNLLIKDGGIPGLCIHLGHAAFMQVTANGEILEVGAGTRLKQIVAEAKKQHLGGFEFMEGIPGNLGGALRMNAGAMQGWTMEVVEEIRSVDLQGRIQVIPRAQLEVHYRNVPHFNNHIALSAKLRGNSMNPEKINEKLKKFSGKRWESQPAAPSAGCVFKNPGPCPAGKLIDELGLKNMAVGKARVSEVHGNFIVNDGGATATEVLELIDKIKTEARVKRGIELETEIIVIGEDV